jgi:hypothetical protein
MLRKIFGSRSEGEREDWGKLNSRKLYNLYSTANVIPEIESS